MQLAVHFGVRSSRKGIDTKPGVMVFFFESVQDIKASFVVFAGEDRCVALFQSQEMKVKYLKKTLFLPLSLPPRLLNREAAAEYVNVSPNTFDEMVRCGSMPAPVRLSERRFAWDVRELDAAVSALPRHGGPNNNDSGWEDFDAP